MGDHERPQQPHERVRDRGGHADRAVLDIPALLARLRVCAMLLAVLAVAGLIFEGLVTGLAFTVMVRWAAILVAAVLVCAAVLVALDALRGADAAQRRGERLSGDDVGLIPPRRPRE